MLAKSYKVVKYFFFISRREEGISCALFIWALREIYSHAELIVSKIKIKIAETFFYECHIQNHRI